MKKKALTDDQVLAKRFPSRGARQLADEATDALSPDMPMTVFIDTWIATYVKAGGRQETFED